MKEIATCNLPSESAPVVRLLGDFVGSNGGDRIIPIARAGVTVTGTTPRTNTSVRLFRIGFQVVANRVAIRNLNFLDLRDSAVRIGKNSGAVRASRIVGNKFNRIRAPQGVIKVDATFDNGNTLISWNTIHNWAPREGGTFHAIKVGSNRLQQGVGALPGGTADPDGLVYQFLPEFTSTWIRHNRITNNYGLPAFSSAIQLNNPAVVHNNCVVGSFNGISTKSDGSVVTSNTIRSMTETGLYMRDGDQNRFEDNLVTHSFNGFETISGKRTIFRNNRISQSCRAGQIHAAQHGGTRSNSATDVTISAHTNITDNESLVIISDQTSYQFTSDETLFSFNSFMDNEQGVFWWVKEENWNKRPSTTGGVPPWHRPTNVWFYKNRFVPDGSLTFADAVFWAFHPLAPSVFRHHGNLVENGFMLAQSTTVAPTSRQSFIAAFPDEHFPTGVSAGTTSGTFGYHEEGKNVWQSCFRVADMTPDCN